jgi:hypothetical protein
VIVASGCSFTDKDWSSNVYPDYDCSYPKWPQLVADELGQECVNLGRGGYGNDYIQITLSQFILENYRDIDAVFVSWSEASRFHLYYNKHFNPLVWLRGQDGDPYSDGYTFLTSPYIVGQDLANYLTKIDTAQSMMRKFYNEVYVVQELCKVLGIKYVFSSALRPYNHKELLQWDPEHPFKKVIAPTVDFNSIDKDHYIGWPVWSESGGFCMYDKITKTRTARARYTVGANDGHPSAHGHKLIADMHIIKYGELYG